MKKHYKIIKVDYINDDGKDSKYKIQQKSWFGFWFTPLDADRLYDSIDDAKDVLKQMLFTSKTSTVYNVYVDKNGALWLES